MEGPFPPRDPQSRLGARGAGRAQGLPCRVDELAMALRASAAIAEPRFSWITAEQVVSALRSGKGDNMIIVDVRDEKEKEGGHIPSAARVPLRAFEERLDELVALWRAGKHIVIHCTRSLSRAPAATHQLLRRIELQGSSTAAGAGGISKVSILAGGFCGYLEHVMTAHARLVDGGDGMLADLVADFDSSYWFVVEGESGAAQRLTHMSECSTQDEAVQERQAAAIMDEEVSEELAFLVQQSVSLSRSRQDVSMPYIM